VVPQKRRGNERNVGPHHHLKIAISALRTKKKKKRMEGPEDSSRAGRFASRYGSKGLMGGEEIESLSKIPGKEREGAILHEEKRYLESQDDTQT